MTLTAANRPWLGAYPEGVPADIDVNQYRSLVHLKDESFQRYADRPAYSFLGKSFSYAQVESQSRQLGAYFQSLGLTPGRAAGDTEGV